MYHLIDPQLIMASVPKGAEFDGEREVHCLCGRQAKLKDVKLCWTRPVGTEDWGYRALCSMGCLTVNITEGSA